MFLRVKPNESGWGKSVTVHFGFPKFEFWVEWPSENAKQEVVGNTDLDPTHEIRARDQWVHSFTVSTSSPSASLRGWRPHPIAAQDSRHHLATVDPAVGNGRAQESVIQ